VEMPDPFAVGDDEVAFRRGGRLRAGAQGRDNDEGDEYAHRKWEGDSQKIRSGEPAREVLPTDSGCSVEMTGT
jgi:hypothetical protein